MKPSGHLLMLSLLIVLLIISITPICQSCLLCYFRLPKRPKSIDYLWPTVLDDINIPETATEMCEMSQRLPFTTNCRNGLAKIFCTLANFMDNNWHDCYLENAEYEECVKCSQNKTDIIRQTSWVITWLDSLGKMPPAVSEGNYYWLGDYEQCSVLRQTNAFDGRYCRIVLEIPDIETYRYCPQSDPLDIYLGFCAPSMCTPQEIIQLAQMVTPYAIRAECETPLDWPLSSRIFLIIFVFWLCFLIIGTFIDVYNFKFLSNKQIKAISQCISIPRNGNIALSTKRSHEYHSVQGIQVITVSIIVAANCFIYILPYIENVLFSYESVYYWQFHPLNNFTYHIDGLIAIDTLITSLLIRNMLETTNDIKKHYFNRLLQILPVFAFIVFFMTFLYERLSSGPIWIHNNLIERCKNSWWKNILFINNFFSSEQTCLDGGYLYSLIVQFYLLLLPMLYLSKRYNTAILAITVSCFFASIIYTFFVMSTTKLSPTLLLTADPISPEIYNTYTDLLYTRPWARAPAFIIGFLFSFLFVDQTPINNDLLWLARFILFLFGAIVIFGLYPYSIGNSTPQIYLAAYSAFHRPLWAFIVCSLVYLGYRNRNIGGLSQFLEWRLFSPFARNIFVVFLISEPVSLYLFSSLHRPLHATIWSLLNIAIGTIILSNFVAFLLDIFISMPIQNIVLELIRDKRCDKMIHADNAHLTFISKTKPDIK
uniref:NRF domain-containing protein n=1 Tax=Onchocerca volvulus TaxID=6282 RepID=A0A8R1Y0N0_ONCVO